MKMPTKLFSICVMAPEVGANQTKKLVMTLGWRHCRTMMFLYANLRKRFTEYSRRHLATMFSFAGTNARKSRDLKEGMKCIRACLNIIRSYMEVIQHANKKTVPLKFWALENPYHGLLKNLLGKPAFIFDSYEFGDGYRKGWDYGGVSMNQKLKTFDVPRSS